MGKIIIDNQVENLSDMEALLLVEKVAGEVGFQTLGNNIVMQQRLKVLLQGSRLVFLLF